MPEKSVRDMTAFERRRHALDSRATRIMGICCTVLGLVALLIGLSFYAYALSRQYIRHAFDTSRHAALAVLQGTDAVTLTEQVMDIYRGLGEEERSQTGTDAYRAGFARIQEEPDYKALKDMLRQFMDSPDVYDVYVAMYDRERSALVYVVDPDEKAPLFPGEWETVPRRETDKFLSWDGTGMLYDVGYMDRYGWLCTAGTPLRAADGGDAAAFVLVDVTIGNMAGAVKTFALQMGLALLAVNLLMALFLSRHMRRTLVKPINAIAEAAVAYAKEKRAGVKHTHFFKDLNIRTGDEVENLGLVMADMEQALTDAEETLTAVAAENERIGTELSLATRIQAAMMPHIFPPFPGRPEFDIYAVMDPAKEVGGDFYDFFLIDEDHLCMVMADVSGKGVPAALFMMASKIILQSVAMLGASPGEILTKTNEAICSNNQEQMFVTVWLGILEISTGKLTAANAGHEYPILREPDGTFALYKDRHGFVIGGMDGVKYKEYTLQLQPGSKLFVYTDGVTEATDEAGRLFGTERLLAALNEDPDAAPDAILNRVRRAVDGFVGEAEPFDDLTMLCFAYTGTRSEEGPVRELTVDAAVENIERVTAFVNEALQQADCPKKTMAQVDMVIDEVFANIAKYAYAPDRGRATVRVGFEQGTERLVLTFIDSGTPYDPLAAEDPDITLSAEDRPVGGLGVFLVKQFMDKATYEYRDGRNILRLKKALAPTTQREA